MRWGPSNPLWRWQHRKSKRHVKHKTRQVVHVVRRRRWRSYYRRARRAGGGMMSGIGGKAMAGGKLALAGLIVGLAGRAAPQFLSNPLIRGGLGLVIPNFKGIPIGNVMVASSINEVASPILSSITGGAASNGSSNPYSY